MNAFRNDYDLAAQRLRAAKCAVASTGAGVSVESGIPDFRSAGGIWSKYPPEEYASIEAFIRDPAKVWRFWNELAEQFGGCRPNPAHHALAQLERAGMLHAVITQNVDNLHQEAGNTRVVEYHGNTRRIVCLECSHGEEFGPEDRPAEVPRCGCGAPLKPDVVMFGEMIPPKAMLQAEGYARSADLMIVVGTSAQVYPAAELPYTAKQNGAFIVECNREPTDFTGSVTDVFIEGPAGETLPRLAALAADRSQR